MLAVHLIRFIFFLSGKTVILTGHSLGGSLALLLALDIAVNHVQNESTDTCSNYNRKEETTESEINTNILTEDVDEKGEKIKEDMNVTQDAVRKRDLQCGSYNHHRGRRCTDVAEPLLLNQMHVVTFGQPDLASSSFFESVKAGSQTARSLLEERYMVSPSKIAAFTLYLLMLRGLLCTITYNTELRYVYCSALHYYTVPHSTLFLYAELRCAVLYCTVTLCTAMH